jgi:hypothetical protein
VDLEKIFLEEKKEFGGRKHEQDEAGGVMK